MFLRRRDGDGLLAGMWDLPPARANGRARATVRHGVLNKRLVISVYEDEAHGEGRWFSPRELRRAPLATAARKCLHAVGFVEARGG